MRSVSKIDTAQPSAAQLPGGASRSVRRRKDARPGEIIEAAIEVFTEKGFAAARTEDIAKRAGVSKATIFVYFPTKEDLFRGAARTILDANVSSLRAITAAPNLPIEQFISALLQQAAMVGADGQVSALLKLLMREASSFPDLAQVWYDEVLSKVMALIVTAIEAAQARGEIRPYDARLLVFSILGPLIAGLLVQQIFAQTSAPIPDLKMLADQHARVVLSGLGMS